MSLKHKTKLSANGSSATMRSRRRRRRIVAALVLAGSLLLSTGCERTIVRGTTIPRPAWHNPPAFTVERFPAIDERGDALLIYPAEAYIEAQLLLKEHIKRLHAAPWWEGEAPPFAR